MNKNEHIAIHMENINNNIIPQLKKLFAQKSEKYCGIEHDEQFNNADDIIHVMNEHVIGKLSSASLCVTHDNDQALISIASAIGSLCALYGRVKHAETTIE